MSTVQHLERAGEPRLAFRIDTPPAPARGQIVMIHGYAEYFGRYDRVVDLWRAQGLAVARFDLRGHGLSGGPRGHILLFEDYVRDVRAVLDRLNGEAEWTRGKRPIVFGHSLGGLIAAESAASLGDAIAGLAMTSPFFGLRNPVSAVQRVLARVGSRLLPGARQPSGLRGEDMTHDLELARGYDTDPQAFHHVTARWFVEVARAQEEAPVHATRLRIPLFCIAAGDDRVVSVAATERFFSRAGSREKELDVRPGLFHEVLNELDWRSHAIRLGERFLSWSEP